jgi:hypothetical protein
MDEFLEEFLFGHLDADLSFRFASHLAACPDCQARLDNLRRFVEDFREAEPVLRCLERERALLPPA